MEVNIIHKFEKIYNHQSDSIFRFCLVRVSDREQALDITQETFLRLWQNFLLGKEEIINEKAFLFKIAHNLIIDWYRKKKSLSLEKLMDNDKENIYNFPDESSLGQIEVGFEGRFLIDKIEELDLIYRDPVYLRFVEDLSPKEIGEILNVSANVVSVRINRGLLELRKKTGYDKSENK